MDNTTSIIANMQTSIDILKKDNLGYISLINDLKQDISNLKDNIDYKNKQIDKLNIKLEEYMKKDINRINDMINNTPNENLTQDNNSIFTRIFRW
jgi:hypothetical protein